MGLTSYLNSGYMNLILLAICSSVSASHMANPLRHWVSAINCRPSGNRGYLSGFFLYSSWNLAHFADYFFMSSLRSAKATYPISHPPSSVRVQPPISDLGFSYLENGSGLAKGVVIRKVGFFKIQQIETSSSTVFLENARDYL